MSLLSCALIEHNVSFDLWANLLLLRLKNSSNILSILCLLNIIVIYEGESEQNIFCKWNKILILPSKNKQIFLILTTSYVTFLYKIWIIHTTFLLSAYSTLVLLINRPYGSWKIQSIRSIIRLDSILELGILHMIFFYVFILFSLDSADFLSFIFKNSFLVLWIWNCSENVWCLESVGHKDLIP